jgi:Ca-activated chloride channel homolog
MITIFGSIRLDMKISSLIVCAALAIAPAFAQNPPAQQQEIPDAPSTTLAPKPVPKPPPPQPPPAQTQPSTPAPAPAQAKPAPAEPIDAKALDPDAAPKDPAAAQQGQQPGAPDAVTTLKKQVNEVNVIFTVTDKHGRFVKNLKANDFRVLDDKQPPANIINFASETNLPLRVGLLIDVSNSIRDRFKFEQEAAVEFLSQIVKPRVDQAFTIGFDTTPEVTQDFTDNTEKLSNGVRILRPGGGTALYDAVYYACRDKLGRLNAQVPVRRAIILITDGEDNQSRVTREEAIEMAQRSEVIIYAISTNVSGMKLRGDKVLERMAEATGGRAFFPFKLEDISNYFTEIQEELRSQYLLAYKPPPDFQADGRFHSIDIFADNKNLHVRAKKGYYAPRQ